jgi:hypothetical protein
VEFCVCDQVKIFQVKITKNHHKMIQILKVQKHQKRDYLQNIKKTKN